MFVFVRVIIGLCCLWRVDVVKGSWEGEVRGRENPYTLLCRGVSVWCSLSVEMWQRALGRVRYEGGKVPDPISAGVLWVGVAFGI